VDYGRRRIGLALSDATGLLARPWQAMAAAATPGASVDRLADLLRTTGEETSDLAGIVVGLPRRLGGEDTDGTGPAREFARLLGERTGLGVHLQDERLTSLEAEALIARREPDWRRRKPLVDAMAAAIILQDFLDGRARDAQAAPPADSSSEC